MNKDKLFQLLKRFNELERAQKDLDFKRSEWCKEVRAEFEKGETGDAAFINWCVTELGVTAYGARELLTRAIASTVVPDSRSWNMVGGFKAIRPLTELSRRDQVTVLEAAKTQARAPINIMRERGLIKTPTKHINLVKPAPAPLPVFVRKPEPVKQDAYLDAVALSQYIAKTSKSIPKDILAIVNRYSSFMRKAA